MISAPKESVDRVRLFVKVLSSVTDEELVTTMTLFVSRLMIYGFSIGFVFGVLVCGFMTSNRQ
jgi:hypothetical protein